MTNFANVERRHLAALLRRVGPDAPTLCEGWKARDLAVHLVIRDGRPDAAVGILAPKLPVLGSHFKSVANKYNDMPWEELVDLVERPPLYSPGRWSPVDKRMNTSEFFVHHEDVRRAQPQWHARQLLHDEQKDLWNTLKLMGSALLRKESNSVVLLANGFGAVRGGKRSARHVDLVRGEPSELLLWAFGRQEQADVQITQE
ncbi:TIGR03085 family protein [Kocuria sp. cx-455]|uniref:TIGR03085 family metal-binding protein n=1 Tax=unclassified Candidatus Sulfotelmatobacter TaxID=2635724 RepID=UPI00168A1C45|nr:MULTISPECIES: TIGR03085 family metal-binding protein [unclassified Candidatus Sulfotelmatobacter]MBD2762860.1 TIGR03085 family protein [Kocuria sp. cx-116]MBD2765091.1 TIGR03085 family protein [Kocuria sp. cx-455]